MNIKDQINYWAKCVESLDIQQILESMTPHDKETLLASFKSDVSQEKMSPTVEFLETAYDLLCKNLFKDKMPKPEELIFKVSSKPRNSMMGMASARINNILHTVIPSQIYLNSAKTLTLHEWLEVVVHEMVHIVDYVQNPDHFLGFYRRSYDSHGYWFTEYGKQFLDEGFNVQRYCTAEIGINTDDKKIQSSMKNTLFMELVGMKTKDSTNPIIKISEKDKEKYIDYITYGVSNGRYGGLKSINIRKSENPKIVELRSLRMRDRHSSLKYYFFNDSFKNKFGPFETIEKLDVLTLEDKDEVDYDEMNHIDDEYARKIYDNITNVVDVKKIEDGVYEIGIF